VDPNIWVDASMDWGIGIIIADHWAAWKLVAGWNSLGRDIGWAESIALELVVIMIVDQGFNDCHVMIRGDNTGIIDAFNRGRSRNVPRNDSI